MKALFCKPWFQGLLITAICVGGYFVLRGLSVYNCGFLHATAPLRTEGNPNDEFCEVTSNQFIDLQQTRFAVRTSVTVCPEGNGYLFSLANSIGRPVGWDEIAITHTEKIHLLIIDPSMEDYHHVHPMPTGDAGIYRFHFSPRPDTQYRMIAEFVPRRTQTQVVVENFWPEETRFKPVAVALTETATGSPKQVWENDDYRVELMLPFTGLQPMTENEVLLQVTSRDGTAVPLNEIMGSYGHLVAFDREGRGYAHFHPINAEGTSPTLRSPTRPLLPFSFNGLSEGSYRLWVQIKLDGAETFIPFDLTVVGAPET